MPTFSLPRDDVWSGGNLDGRSAERNLQLDDTRRKATDVFTNFPARRVMGCMQPIDASDWSSIAAECNLQRGSFFKTVGPSAPKIGLVAPATRSHDGPTGISVNKGQTNAPMILPASCHGKTRQSPTKVSAIPSQLLRISFSLSSFPGEGRAARFPPASSTRRIFPHSSA